MNNFGQKDDNMSNTKYISNKMGNSQDGNPNTPDIPVTNTNIDPYLSIIASVLMIGGGILVGKGYLTSSALAQIVGLILSLCCTVYVTYKGTTNAKVSSLAKSLDVPKEALARHIVAMKRRS